MLPLNTSSCPIFTLHGYIAYTYEEYKHIDMNATLEHVSKDLGSSGPALATGIALALVGLVGLFVGARLVRPMLVLICGCAGALAAQAALFNIDALLSATPCVVGGVSIALAAIIAALLGLFLLNFAFFMGGAAIGLALVSLTFRFLPMLDVDAFGWGTLDGHGLVPFWAAALVAAVAFGCLLVRKKEQQAILIVLTSLVAACFVTKGANMINASQKGPKVPPEASAAVLLVLFLLGAAVQCRRHKKRKAEMQTAYLPYTDTSAAPQRLLRP